MKTTQSTHRSVSTLSPVWVLMIALWLALYFLMCWECPAQAPAPDDAAVALPADPVATLILQLAGDYPWLVTAFAVIGLLRSVFKPIMSWWHARVAATEDPADDAQLEQVERSGWFQAVAWVLDYTASIKVSKKG